MIKKENSKRRKKKRERIQKQEEVTKIYEKIALYMQTYICILYTCDI